MSKDFSKYQNIIDDFSGQVLNQDFEASFSVAVEHLPKNERFLLKMELKRLAAPCSRLIDLRGHVNGECKQFEHDGRVHFLDDIAIKTFNKALALYKSYTFGVYEAAMNTDNNFRVIYQKGKGLPDSATKVGGVKIFEKKEYLATFHSFAPYHQRCEERMNFVSPIQVIFENNSKLECTSVDLSVTGCKFKLKGIKPMVVGQHITLRFTALEKEFTFENNNGFAYEIKSLLVNDDTQLVSVVRILSKEAVSDAFTTFLTRFIQENKRRYKINLDNTIEALTSRSFEQYVLPESNELPIFIEQKKNILTPKYVLTCYNNQNIYQYWQDEKHASTLNFLTTPERIERLKENAAIGKQLLVFSFIHVRDEKYYFYSADEFELAKDAKFREQFLGFATSKTNFAITQLSLIDVMLERATSPLSIPYQLPQKNDEVTPTVFDNSKSILENIPFIVVASDATRDDITKSYQLFSYKNINIEKLKKYGHKRLNKPYKITEMGIHYNNKRKEQRFKYTSAIHLEIDHVIRKGISHDFSVSGLKVELDKNVVLSKGDVVSISFPELQKISSNFNLKKLSYEVVGVNSAHATINLRASTDKHQHMGRKFFRALIEKNIDKLIPNENFKASSVLVNACRNIYSSSSMVPSLIIQTSGSRYKIESLASGQKTDKLITLMSKLSDTPNVMNLYPILGRVDIFVKISESLKKMQRSDAVKTLTLYIAIKNGADEINDVVTTKMASELNSTDDRNRFIDNALAQGEFFCVMMKISRTAEPDIEYLNPELNYIALHAIHKAKQIEQEIWSVAGIAQIFDTTQEALFNYQLTH